MMPKRKTSRQNKTPAKPKAAKRTTTEPKEDPRWHICEHCIHPLYDGFFKIDDVWSSRSFPPKPHYEYDFDRYFELHQKLEAGPCSPLEGGWQRQVDEIMQQLGWEPPTRYEIALADSVCDFDFAINWLKVHLSIDFANEFELTVMGPAYRLSELEDRACQMLDNPGIMVPPALRCILFARRCRVVNMVLLGRYKYLRETLEPEKWRNLEPSEDRILWELISGHVDVRQAILRALSYLNDMDIILEARFNETDIDPNAVSSHRWTAPMTKTTIADIFICHRNRVDEQVLSTHRTKPVGSRICMLVEDMPPDWRLAIEKHKKRIKRRKDDVPGSVDKDKRRTKK